MMLLPWAWLNWFLGAPIMKMHKGVAGWIRKATIGRWLLFHINTGLFWIYGVSTFWLAYSITSFCLHSTGLRILVSLALALFAAFTFAQFVRLLFWKRFHNIWMDIYIIGIFVLAILISYYMHDVQAGRKEALSRLVTHIVVGVAAGLVSLLLDRRRRREQRSSELPSRRPL